MARAKTPLKSICLSACGRIMGKAKNLITRGRADKSTSDAIDSWNEIIRGEPFGRWPLPASFTFNLKYQDIGDNRSRRIVFTSHGSPGSHEDFKYMTPKLTSGSEGIRVVGVNWPEHGHSEVLEAGEYFYRHSSEERAELLDAFLQRLEIDEVDVMVGHSFGCYPLIAFAADEQYRNRCKSLLLINYGGGTPHKGVRPYQLYQIIASLCYHPIIGSMVSQVAYWIAKYCFGFRVKSRHSSSINMTVIAHADFRQIPQHLETLRTNPSAPRLLLVYAEDDPLIDKESSEGVAQAIGCPASSVQGWDKDALEKVRAWWKDWKPNEPLKIPKNLAVSFGKGRGGHFLQKHQADFLVECIKIMSDKS